MVKILLGGSPCTYWSICKTKGRETTASGMGWELFRNYVIAKEKFQPDFFLYENNWSAANAIKEQIQEELQTPLFRINARLLSAQNRDRFYVCNWHNELPEDRGVFLRDILETTTLPCNQSGYTLDVKSLSPSEVDYMLRTTSDGRNHFDFNYHNDALDDKAHCITASVAKGVPYNVLCEPIRIGTIVNSAKNQAKHNSKQYRVYSPDGKSTTLCGEGGGVGAKTGLYAVPVMRVPEATKQGYVDIAPGECVDLAMASSKTRRGRRMADKSNCLTTSCELYEYCGTLDFPIYTVVDGHVEVNGKLYPIKLRDGCYIIRKLTVTECCRLQGMPDWWFLGHDGKKLVSDTQAYRGLGNGWQFDTLRYLLETGLKDVHRSEKILCLSMYDGIGTGRLLLESLGFTNIEYHAYEIDKYCIKLTSYRYPDIIHHGDAFQVRDAEWAI